MHAPFCVRVGSVAMLVLVATSCTSFAPLGLAPSPSQSVRLSAASGQLLLVGRMPVDTSNVVRCTAREVYGRFVAQRGDTLVLRGARAFGPATAGTALCAFALDGYVVADAGGPPEVWSRKFSVVKTGLVVASLGFFALLFISADWETTSTSGGTPCSGVFC